MKKKILSVTVLIALCLGLFAFPANASEWQVLYSADGRSQMFEKSQVPAQLTVGWYTEPVQTLYTADGRSMVFPQSQVYSQLQVGWYTEPVVIMNAADGRTTIVKKSEIGIYENVGWYYGNPVTMYSADGRTMLVGSYRVQDYEQVGWYYGIPVSLYAADGRVITVGQNRVPEYTAVGWYTTQSEANRHATYTSPSTSGYYPGSIVPDYTAVTGIALKETYGTDGSFYIYPLTYYGEYYEAIDYYGYLLRNGWTEYSKDSDSDSHTTSMTKGTELVSISVQFKYNEVWIIF